MVIIIGSVAGGLGIIIFICVICLLRCKPKLASSISSKQLLKADPESAFACSTKCQMIAYSFKEVKDVTNDFKNQISEGSCGPVYKGRLSDGREVAVKRCWPSNRRIYRIFRRGGSPLKSSSQESHFLDWVLSR